MRVIAGNPKALFLFGGFFLFSVKVLIVFLKWSKKRRSAQFLDAPSLHESDPHAHLLLREDLGAVVRLTIRVPEYLARGYDECIVEIRKRGDTWVDVKLEELSSEFNIQTRKWKNGKSIFYGKAPQGFVRIVKAHWKSVNGEIP